MSVMYIFALSPVKYIQERSKGLFAMQQKYDALILAGGKGKRLMPLTERQPKPMLPVMNIPVIEHIYRSLAENGCKRVAVAVCHLADELTATGGDTELAIGFFKEESPLGSAGAVKAIANEMCDTFTILCGDAIIDIDLKKHIAEHKKHGGITVLLSHSDTPYDYGTVLLDGDRIKGFAEKPSISDTVTALVSTGIYIVDKYITDYIPSGVVFDMANDLLPLLQSKGVTVYGAVADGEWIDIGNINDYYSCNMRFSGGRSVIDPTAIISDGARTERSIVMRGAKIGDSVINGAIICRNAVIEDGCNIGRGCIVGEGTVLQKGTILTDGVYLAGGRVIGCGSVVSKDWIFGEATAKRFDDDGICVHLDCASALRLGRALSVLGSPARIGVMSITEHSRTADCISLGASEAGCHTVRFAHSQMPVARFCAERYDCDCLAYCVGDDRIFLLGKGGIRLSAAKQKEIIRAIDSACPAEAVEKSILHFDPTNEYTSFLQSSAESLSGAFLPFTEKNDICRILIRASEKLGAETALRQYGYTISADGKSASYRDEAGRTLSYWQLVLLASMSKSEVFLPRETPVSVERYLRSQGTKVNIYNDSESVARTNAYSTPFVNDAALLVLMVEKYLLATGMTAAEAKAKVPEIFVVTKLVNADRRDALYRIDELSKAFGDIKRGVRINYRGGSVAIYPEQSGFRIFAEAVSSEIASELCDLTERRLK